MNLKRIKMIGFIIISCLCFSVFGQTSDYEIDKSNLSKGIIKVNYEEDKGKELKIQIKKGREPNNFALKPGTNYPLQLGKGNYNIFILEHLGDYRYKVLKKEDIIYEPLKENDIYLQSIYDVEWESEMNAVKKAKELTKNCVTEKQKVAAVYKYITSNILYDYEKARTVKAPYLPSADRTLLESKGICYDYTSVFAAMLRSLNIPTKLITGYKNDISDFHAWNQVYLADDNKWVTIDTTYDAGQIKSKFNQMVKRDLEYKIQDQY
ncbi:MAG TPA: transglutaminase domain-containing protein [Epulopiscium sp.]|nr:transglutaminase domain-containing protein [Candidatus Epulonipiscium sp.]